MQFPRATRLVMGFQHRTEAVRFLEDFKERLAKFGLELLRATPQDRYLHRLADYIETANGCEAEDHQG